MKKVIRSLALAVFPISTALGCSAAPEDGAEPNASEAQATITPTDRVDLSACCGVVGGGDIATTSRTSGRIDLVMPSSNSVLYYRYNGSWQPGVQITGVPSGAVVRSVAIANNAGHLEVVAAASNHKVYWAHSTRNGGGPVVFGTFVEIGTQADAVDPNQLGLIAWPDGQLHAFWITQNGNIKHAYGINDFSMATENGDNPEIDFLRPLSPGSKITLNAVSWGQGRIDLILGNGTPSGTLGHHWYDVGDGGWYFPDNQPHREGVNIRTSSGQTFQTPPKDFAVLTSGPQNLDIYTVDHSSPIPNGLYRVHMFGSMFSAAEGSPPPTVYFGDFSSVPGGYPDSVHDALYLDGVRHIFSPDGGTIEVYY